MTELEKALNYYQSGLENKRPDFVPARIRLPARVRGDFPFQATVAIAGDHVCKCNQYGAVSVVATNGTILGIKPKEFEVLEWKKNE